MNLIIDNEYEMINQCKKAAADRFDPRESYASYENELIHNIARCYALAINSHNTTIAKYNRALEDIAELNTKYTSLLEKYYTTFKELKE
jgi:uncharacterized protein YaaN involved in tellurite resistance